MAEDVCRKSYWTQSGGDLLPAGLDYSSLDYGVNSGPATAVKRLQKVLGIDQDGVVGGQTLAAIDVYPGRVSESKRGKSSGNFAKQLACSLTLFAEGASTGYVRISI
ncbi:peptidoglycan-binding protein [Aminobacter anthyllidis]|uniref:peptidoglycan-binding protein n=1 Tax=Aminobacter anthyllidis TaxID=1035067 RepID=UPI003083ABBC